MSRQWSRSSRLLAGLGVLVVVALGVTTPPADADQREPHPTVRSAQVSAASRHDVSKPLKAMARAARPSSPGEATNPSRLGLDRPVPQDRIDAIRAMNPGPPVFPDPTGPVSTQMPTATSFEGVDNPNGYYPPDTVGDVGPNHYLHMVNVSLTIFDKSGTSLFGPVPNNVMWGGFGGDCQATNDGDPIALYDQFADRWLISQFSISAGGYHECVAVSATPDPLGSWNRYSFDYADFPDYPKIGVWPDGYYVTYNMFDDNGFAGTKACALDRAAMLAGTAATQQCFDLQDEWSLLPSDADGATPPPAGSPNYIVGEQWDHQDKLTMYKFAVDWADPSNTTLTGPVSIPVNAFTPACLDVYRGRCVPQPGTAVLLESLGARTMYRLAYRNFGDHESLVTNHTVAMDGDSGLTSQLGIGWYELRAPNAAVPTVFQQGTTADPDGTTFRWMGSMAQDKQGNMALGYSASSTTTFPGIRYNGRLVDDPVNTLPQAEGILYSGGGSQTGSSARWGDYSSMTLDPLDDCTFWYANEYLKATSLRDWSTRIGQFKYPGCTGTAAVPSAPTVTTTPGDRLVTVTFPEPADNGNPINEYKVTASPGGATCTTRVGVTPDPNSCQVTGLTNGQDYQFSVTARNGVGEGASGTANGTPRTVPDAPTAVSGVAGNQQVAVSWSVPASNGGAAISAYTVTSTPGNKTCSTANSACTVTGLTNGQAYTFTVKATNTAGDSADSATSSAVTPRTVPDAPTGVSGMPGNGQVAVSWAAPGSDGGSPITGYTVRSTPGAATCTGALTSCTVTGLTNGQAYTFEVVAANAVGDGPSSAASAPVTPQSDVLKKQTLSVKLPNRIKFSGVTLITPEGARTNADQPVRTIVRGGPGTSSTAGEVRYFTVLRGPDGKVSIRTFGKPHLKLRITQKAPAVTGYTAFVRTATYSPRRKG